MMFVHSDAMQVDPDGRLHTFCHAVHGKWHMMGVSLSAAGSLEWFCQQLCQEIAKGKKNVDPYEILNREAEAIGRGKRGIVFLAVLGRRKDSTCRSKRPRELRWTDAETYARSPRSVDHGGSRVFAS